MTNKTQGITALSLQIIDEHTVAVGPTITLPINYQATVYVHIGRTSTTALSYVECRIETYVNGFWYPVSNFSVKQDAAAIGDITDSTPPSSTGLILSSIADFADNDYILIRKVRDSDMDDISESEWNRVYHVGGGSISVETPIIYDHSPDDGIVSQVTNQADCWVCHLNTAALANFRVVIDTSGAAAPVVGEAYVITLDDM
jgi:hypothetical protein